jgi:hypothetical protein
MIFKHARIWLVFLLFAMNMVGVHAEPPPSVAIGFYTPVIRDLPRKDVEVSLRFWIEELARSIGVDYKPVRFYDDYASLRRDLLDGEINFIVATTMGIVQHIPASELADGFSGYKLADDNLLLVVRRDAGIRSPADLAGKRVGILDGDELSQVYLETLMMRAWGQPDWGRLGAISREQRSSKLTHRLFFGQDDAALIHRNGYEAALALNPQIGQKLEILDDYSFKARSPHIGLFSSRVSPEHRELVTQGGINLNNNVRGRQVMDIYHADRMVRTPVSDLDPVWELIKTHRALKTASVAKRGKR